MDLDVCGVLELLRNEIAAVALGHGPGLGDCTAHAFGAGGEDQFGTIGPQQQPAFAAHRLGHHEGTLVAARRAHHGEADAGIARGRLEDDRIGPDQAGLLGSVDHRGRDAVLDAVGGVEEFELEGDGSEAVTGQAVEFHQRGIADECGDVLCDLHL